MIVVLTFQPSPLGSTLGAWSMSLGPLVDSSSGLPAWIGMHHGQISAVPTLPSAPKPYRTVPNTHTHTHQHTHSTILCHRIRTQSANLASQPGSHYQAHYGQ